MKLCERSLLPSHELEPTPAPSNQDFEIFRDQNAARIGFQPNTWTFVFEKYLESLDYNLSQFDDMPQFSSVVKFRLAYRLISRIDRDSTLINFEQLATNVECEM